MATQNAINSVMNGIIYPTADGNAGETLITNGAGTLTIGILTVPGGGTGAATLTDHGILVGSGVGAVTPLAVMTDGQLAIGSTGVDPSPATLTAGTGISITNAAGAITIDATGSGLAWVDAAGATQAVAIHTSYGANNAGGVVFTLPATAAAGTVFEIVGVQGLWSLAQNALQTVLVGASSTTAGIGGSLTATNLGDSIVVRCITADTDFRVQSMMGNLTIV